MSILIKGMKIPKNCYSCPLYNVFTPSDSKCNLTGICFDRTDEDNVAKTCPLVEVSPHGRWVDRKFEDGEWYHTCSVCGMVLREYAFDNFCGNCGAKMDIEDKGEV